MIKKISVFVSICFISILLVGCGGKSFKDNIEGKTFKYTVEDSGTTSAYGEIKTSHTLIFYKDGKGTSKIDIDFTGAMKEYAEKNISYDNRHSQEDFTYTLDEDKKTVSFKTGEGKYSYNLKYDEDSNCLIDTDSEKTKYC